MSVEAISWAINYPVAISEKAVLFLLANYSNEYGISWCGQKKLADQAGCTERALRNILDRMEDRGVIRRIARRRENGSRRSDLVILEAFPDRAEIPPGMLEALAGADAVAQAQPEQSSGCKANRNLVPNQPERRSPPPRNEVPDPPERGSALDTSLIHQETLSLIPRGREGAAKAGDEFGNSALAAAAIEFASKLGVPFGVAPSLVDQLAPKPSRIEPLPALAAHRGWKLMRQTGYQDMARAAADPENRAALCDAADALEAALAPALPEQAARMIWELGCAMLPRRQGREGELAAARQWLADLADYPADIIDAACAEWRRGANRFAPQPGELLALARPILEARQLWAKRARQLAAPPPAGQPARAISRP